MKYLRILYNHIISIKNPPYFIYHTFHYLNIFVPKVIASIVWNLNKRTCQACNDIIIRTYDGSNQVVHPDATCYNGELWFIATPYPYGMEEYENPCTYKGLNIQMLMPETTPIKKQKVHRKGFHLSDPCIAHRDSLYCMYRESERIGKSQEKNTIWIVKYIEEKKSWGQAKIIFSSSEDALLSPAFLFDCLGVCHMYYVSKKNEKFSLIHTSLSESFKMKTHDEVAVDGIPEGYDLWHIGIVYSDNKDKCTIKKSKLLGLFLLKNKNKEFRLYLSESQDILAPWTLKKEISLQDGNVKNIRFFYKSCFLPYSDSIIISYVDDKKRYRLSEVTIKN